MCNFSPTIHKFNFIVFNILFCFYIVSAYGGETPSVPGTKVYFINLKEGQKIIAIIDITKVTDKIQ